MYGQIKAIADEALRVQNKLGMEKALIDISALCDAAEEAKFKAQEAPAKSKAKKEGND